MTQQQSIRILSIDDKMITTDLDHAGYRKMGVEVRSARSFEDAQKVIDGEGVDLIVINMDYRKVNAALLCKHFKGVKSEKPRPVVLTSVVGTAEMRQQAVTAGADLFVLQPVPRQLFIEKLRQLLAQQTRTTERVRVAGDAEVSFNGATHAMPVGDLSISGILLGSPFELQSGKRVQVAFEIPGYKKPVEATGEVVRVLHNAANGRPEFAIGLGIRFVDFKGDGQKRLEKYVEKTSTDNEKMLYYL